MIPKATTRRSLLLVQTPNPSLLSTVRSLWSTKKDPTLESALSRNRRWIINNQIKYILLRSPNQTSTVRSLQKRFKTLDLQGNALNWLRKYPCCFDTFPDAATGDVLFCLTKRMSALVDEENNVRLSEEPNMANRLAKILLLSRNRRINVVKLNELKRSLGFADDFVLRFVTRYPEMFRVVENGGRRTSMEIEFAGSDDGLGVSAVEAVAGKEGKVPEFKCILPASWVRSWEKLREFNELEPYYSPYRNVGIGSEKWTVGMVHELLSLTLWKKASILKLGHFRKEFGLPEDLNRVLLRHPCVFYVSNRYKLYTVVLREGYEGSELVYKDPIVVVKEKFGELMQEGLHEYNRRRHQVNLEKKMMKGEVVTKRQKIEDVEDEEEADARQQDAALRTEERKRFYKTLFDDILP